MEGGELPFIKNLDTGETILLTDYAAKPVESARKQQEASKPPLARVDPFPSGVASKKNLQVKVTSQPVSTSEQPRAAPQVVVKASAAQRGKRDASDVRLLQELYGHTGVIWVAKFNNDGRYLATAGQDCVLRVWEVWLRSGRASSQSNSPRRMTSPTAPPVHHCVFKPSPYREYSGHTEDILDLSWSRTEFILTSSIDRTVRLWHLTQLECLRVFEHADIVTSVEFHPQDARRFLTGCVDGKLRMWSTLENRALGTANLHHDMITAIALLWDARSWKVLVGTAKGKCRVYDCFESKLDYITQLDVRNKKRSSGKKVTAIYCLPTVDKSQASESRFLVSSNDSRLRLFNGYAQEWKYKGHKNSNTQVRACMSTSGDQIISGSDDGNVYLWDTNDVGGTDGKNAAFEYFQADAGPVTMAVFGPDTMQSWLGSGFDFDLQPLDQENCCVIVTVGFSGRVRVFQYCRPQTDKTTQQAK